MTYESGECAPGGGDLGRYFRSSSGPVQGPVPEPPSEFPAPVDEDSTEGAESNARTDGVNRHGTS